MAQDPHLIQIRELKDTISQLNETISLLNNNLQESLKREAVMQEQIDYLTKKLFGRSSEKKVSQTEGQLSLFDEAENEADPDAEEPEALIPHSPASAPAVAWVIYQKYNNAMPLYRLEKDWLTLHGVSLTRATLANWIIYCSEHYFKPLYEFFHRELLKRKFLMADETRVQVLKEPERNPETNSFMWLFRTGEDGEPPIIIYKYTTTRAKYNAEDFLNGFEGYLETDGYQGYNNLPGIKRCCCWAHIRRAFIDAIPKGKENCLDEPAVQAVQYCDKLFDHERISKEKQHTFEERREYRIKNEKPVINAFWNWIGRQHPVKNSRLYKAVNYALNRKDLLETYLEDGRCSLSNNLSENAIRPFTVSRKNWLFSDTAKGADSSAICYTMIEMAKAHGLSPFSYLNFILTNHPEENPNEEELARLAPWNDLVQEHCKSQSGISK